jgi:hypothetical protein
MIRLLSPMLMRNSPEETNLPDNIDEHEKPNTENPSWEENAPLRLQLAVAGYGKGFNPTLADVTEDYYESKLASRYAWWRWRCAVQSKAVPRVQIPASPPYPIASISWLDSLFTESRQGVLKRGNLVFC